MRRNFSPWKYSSVYFFTQFRAEISRFHVSLFLRLTCKMGNFFHLHCKRPYSRESLLYTLQKRRRELCTMRQVRGQTLGKFYCILANKEKRAVYDETGKRPDLGNVYCILSNKEKRAVYDEAGKRLELEKVYCILSNMEKRAVYDEAGKRPDSRESLLYILQQGEGSCIRRGR